MYVYERPHPSPHFCIPRCIFGADSSGNAHRALRRSQLCGSASHHQTVCNKPIINERHDRWRSFRFGTFTACGLHEANQTTGSAAGGGGGVTFQAVAGIPDVRGDFTFTGLLQLWVRSMTRHNAALRQKEGQTASHTLHLYVLLLVFRRL
jgi:hypothetical protein